MTTLELTDEQIVHLRTLLFEDVHELAARLAKDAHSAHEERDTGHVHGDNARTTWASCGMQDSAAILDLIGWDAGPEAERLRKRGAA